MSTEQPRPNAPGVRVCDECARRFGPDGWSNDCRHYLTRAPVDGTQQRRSILGTSPVVGVRDQRERRSVVLSVHQDGSVSIYR